MAKALMPERNCSTCTENQKKMWGCDENTVIPLTFDGEDILRCPNRPYLDNKNYYNSIFEQYHLYKHYGWSEEGTWKDQPNYLVECIVIIDITKQDIEMMEQETNRKQSDIAKKYGTHKR